MKIHFFDINKDLIQIYKKYLSQFNYIISNFYVSDVENIINATKINCIVSPANSFGHMNGGIDKIYTKIFNNIEETVQKLIKNKQIKESGLGYYLPVGQNLIVKTHHHICSNLIIMPTMFLPQNITNTKNIYFAFYGLLNNYHNYNCDILCPGLGTGVGGLSYEESAKQIRDAILDFQNSNPK
jgi:O-acetyl-ADP-ribose deacetylase (regulator of RNase III)